MKRPRRPEASGLSGDADTCGLSCSNTDFVQSDEIGQWKNKNKKQEIKKITFRSGGVGLEEDSPIGERRRDVEASEPWGGSLGDGP